jgi:hypothetical protein
MNRDTPRKFGPIGGKAVEGCRGRPIESGVFL